MSVSLTDNVDDQNLAHDDPTIVLNLNTSFTDDATSDRFVRFDSALGSFFVELFPSIVPNTVANFLNYVKDGRFNDSIIHRSIPGFVTQGGGFTFISDEDGVEEIPTDPPILNEFENWFDLAFGGLEEGDPVNTRGTISMALPADPDGGTSGFFFNDVDNVADHPPGGNDLDNNRHAVFGEAMDLAVLDAIIDLPTFNFGGAFTNFPVLDDTADPLVTKTNLALFPTIATSDLNFELVSNDNPDIVDVVVGVDGTLTLTPTGLGGGNATVTVRGTDLDDATSVDDTFSVTIDGPPVARVDLALTNNTVDPVLIAVLGNDSGASSLDPATVAIIDDADLGDIVVNPVTGEVTYTPRPEFVDSDTFTYTVMDIDGRTSNEATVTVTTHHPPVANDDDFEGSDVNATIEIDVVANDTDDNGEETIDASTVTIVQAPAVGTVSIDPVTGVVTYAFDDGMGGDDTFTYTVEDTSGRTSNIATVNVSVQADPVAENDEVSVDIPADPIVIDILANDTDDNGDGTIDATTVDIITDPTNGTLTVDPVTGEATYTPDAGVAADGGNDNFAYTVTDTTGRVSVPAVVTIAIEAPPVATDNMVERIVSDIMQEVGFSILFDDTDTNGDSTIDATTVTVGTAPTFGSVSVDPDSGFMTYTPDPGFTGGDSLTYTVMDDTGRVSNAATITIDIRIAPVAGDDAIIIPLDDSAQVLDILANDTDDNGPATIDRTTLTIVDDADEGTVTIDPGTQIVTYTPGPTFDGGDSFTYTVEDEIGLVSNVATVTVGFAAGTPFGTFFAGTDLTITINGVAVTFRLAGNGVGTVVGGGGEDIDVDLAGTDTTSRHTIATTGGDNTFLIHEITADGSMASIVAPTTSLGGDIMIPGTITRIHMADMAENQHLDIQGTTPGVVVHLTFADVVNLVINSGIAIQSLVVESWTDSDDEQDAVNAPAIRQLISRGAFQADLNLDRANDAATTLVSARIHGTLSNVNWTIAGNVGTIIAGTATNFALVAHIDDISGASLRALRFGRVFGSTDVTVEGTIHSITAVNWSSGSIQGERVRSILITGERNNRALGVFNANLELSGGSDTGHRLARVRVANAIGASLWNVAGTIGSIQGADWNGGELNAVSVRSIIMRRYARDNLGGSLQVDMNLTGGSPKIRAGRIRAERQIRTSTWNIDGPVGAILADVVTRLTLNLGAPLQVLQVGDVNDSDFNIAGRITRLRAETWANGSITATSIGLLRVSGSRQSLGAFSGDVTLTGDDHRLVLGLVKVFGAISGGNWNLTGTVGNIIAFRWDGGSFTTEKVRRIILRAPNWFGPTAGDMAADLNITGAGGGTPVPSTLTFGYVLGGTWNIGNDVARLNLTSTVLAWSANVTGHLRSTSVRRDFSGTLTAASFGTVSVGGELNRATILAGADLGADATVGGTDANADTYGPGSINRLTVRQRVRASILGAGLDPSNDRFNDGDDVIQGGTASYFTVLNFQSTLDEDTLIGAGMYPTTIVIDGRAVPSDTVNNLL